MSNSKNSSQVASAGLYLPGLNGIRAIASLAVLVAHMNDRLVLRDISPTGPINLGRFAVSIFFALSGFLITYLLILEKDKTGTVAIAKFYIRRILRIWPLYFTYIAVAIICNYFWDLENPLSGILITLFFIPNFTFLAPTAPSNLHHYWSLGVEEQFYLFWPMLMRLAKNAGIGIGGFLIAFLLLKIGLRYAVGGFSTAYTFIFMTRFDCMAIGGLGAWFMWRGISDSIKTIIFHPIAQTLTWLGIVVISFEFVTVPTLIAHQVIALLTVLLILNLTGNPKPLLNLEGKIWSFLGNTSFGLYVWHPAILYIVAEYTLDISLPLPIRVIAYFLVAIGLSILISYLSLRFLERPFLKLKDRFAMVKTKRQAKDL